jgi:hypothetical protein
MGDVQMKFTKTTAAATVGLGALVAALAYSTTSIAVAQTPATPTPAPKAAAAAPAASTTGNSPRFVGTFTGTKADAIAYSSTCPAFTFGMDAAAIQESNSRAYVEGEARRFETVRDRWDAYEDCVADNAGRDVDSIRTVLGDTLSDLSTSDATLFNALNTAAQANVARISAMPAAKAPKAAKNAPAATVAAAPLSAWTPPTGRLVGTLTGTFTAPVYTTGCPSPMGDLSVASFATVASRDGFNALIEELKARPDRINQVRTCRQENGQADYDAIRKSVTDSVNASLGPRKNAFEREYAAVRFQLNEHRNPGGLLAPAEMGRAKAKAPAAKLKAKKK